ncbi:MAG TPA: hypothetical protein PLL69_01455 [Gemmatimonadales bacterium]|nr:hypothetical protein [Gemmatimonadales bacterium]
MRPVFPAAMLSVALAWSPAAAQRADQLSNNTRQFVSVAEPVVALTGVTVIDGTGAAPRAGQTIVIRDGRIAAVGADGATAVPAGARVIPLSGHTVIPGIIGMHDHMFYTAPGGRRRPSRRHVSTWPAVSPPSAPPVPPHPTRTSTSRRRSMTAGRPGPASTSPRRM